MKWCNDLAGGKHTCVTEDGRKRTVTWPTHGGIVTEEYSYRHKAPWLQQRLWSWVIDKRNNSRKHNWAYQARQYHKYCLKVLGTGSKSGGNISRTGQSSCSLGDNLWLYKYEPATENGEGDLQQGMLHLELIEEHTRRPSALRTCTVLYQGSESVWVDGTSTHLQRVSSCGERSCTYIEGSIGCLRNLDCMQSTLSGGIARE